MHIPKVMIMFVFVIMLSSLVCATQYNTTIEKNLKSSIDFGNTSLGNIVLNTFKTDNKEYKFVGDALNITILDSVKNNYSYPIRIGDYILATNDIVQFVSPRTYEIKNVSNSIVLGNLTVFDISKPRINLSSNSFTNFNISFSDNNFIPDDAEIININLNYLGIVETGQYDLNMKLNNQSFTHKFNVTQTKLFNIREQSCTTNFEIGKSGLFCRFNIINKGNTNLEIKFKSNDYNDYFYFLPTSLFIDQNKSIDIMYDTKNLNTVINNKQINLTLYDTGAEQSIVLNISFVDKQPPSFSDVNVSTQLMSHKEYNVSFKINENFGINTSLVRILQENGDKIEEYGVNNSQFNVYNFEYEPGELGKYMMEFYAKDNNGNENTTRVNFETILLTAFNFSDNINLKKSMNTRYSMKIIGDILEGEDLNVTLKELTYNCSWKMKVVDGKDNEFFIENVNQSVKLSNEGAVKMGFMGDCLMAYDGIMGFSGPSYAQVIPDMVFTGDIIDYEIPDEIDNTNWNGGSLVCKVNEKDNLEDSTYDCSMSVPLSNASGGIIPVTKKQMDNSESLFTQQIDKLKSKNNWKWFFLILMAFILIIVSLFCYFSIYIHPYLYIKTD